MHTGTDSNSGTDADISVQLKDSKGIKSSEVVLSDIHPVSNAFEKGDKATFNLYVPSSFDKCTQVIFGSDNSNFGAGWLLDYFKIVRNIGEGSDSGFEFSSGQWLAYKRKISFGKDSGKTGSYYLEVKTKDKSKAGTDSNIWLTLIGSKGTSPEIELDIFTDGGNNFEGGDLDYFNVGFETDGI